jgi:hypothetical protein
MSQMSRQAPDRSPKLAYGEYGPVSSTLLKESSRLERKVQSDLKALGWAACAGARGLGLGGR